MELRCLSIITILVSVAVESGHAIQCYQCAGQIIPGLVDEEPNCFDPFNADGIQITSCDGKCFANSTTASIGGMTFQQVQRGCASNPDECLPIPPFCQDVPDPTGTGESGRYCAYCCDSETGELCNSLGLEDAAASPDNINCWTCEENVTDATPGSCASDDFNGNGAIQYPCPSMCLTQQVPGAQGMPNKVSRGCDFFMGQYCALPGITCCEGNLCNVGSNVDGGMRTVTSTVGSDVIGGASTMTSDSTFQCWRCDSAVTNGTADETPCFTGIFPAENVITIDCPSKACISYTYVGEGEQVFSRGCVTPDIDNLGYCTGSIPQIQDVECCTETLCNSEGSLATIATTTDAAKNTVATSVATITTALLVSLCNM